MDEALTLIISGTVTGAIYSLVAAGVTLSYTTTGVFNFAYGAIAYACAVAYFELNTALGWPIVPSALVVVGLLGPALGLALDRLVFRRLASASPTARVVVPVGLMIAIPALTRFVLDGCVSWFGLDSLQKSDTLNSVGFPSGIGPVPRSEWKVPGGATLDSNQLALVIAAVLAATGLWVLMRFLHVGLRMRAVVDSRSLAQLRGIDAGRMSALAWAIGCSLAATAGVLGAPVLGSLNANSFVTVQFVASAAAVLGGLRSVPVAAFGGVLLGVTQNLVFRYATFASDIKGFNTSVPFVLLLVGLIVMARDRRRIGGTAAEPDESAGASSPLPRLLTIVASAAFILWLFVLASDYWIGVTITGLALSIVMLSFVVVTGLGGMVSLAQATFVTGAGLVTGLLVNRYDVPFIPAAMVGVIVAMVLGAVVALPALRLGGLPLALATLALAFVGDTILFKWDWLRNSQTGWSFDPPVVGPIDLADRKTFAVVLLGLIAMCVAVVRNLERSASGRSIMAVRGSTVAAATSGIEPARVKLFVFATSAAIAGLGGVMLATANRSATDVSYPATIGLLWVAQVVLFGVRRPGPAVAAGVVAAIFPELLRSGFAWPGFVPTWLDWDGTRSAEIPAILFGLGAVVVAQHPDGFIRAGAVFFSNRTRRSRDIVAFEDSPSTVALLDGDAAPALAIRELRAGYGAIEVLHGVNLTLHSGSMTAVLGPNGSGKTTLCRAMTGLVEVTGGTSQVGGVSLDSLTVDQRSGATGLVLVPQDRGVFPGLTVDDNLRVWLREPTARAEAYARFPALERRRNTPAASLSGGEQQQLSLAPVVVRQPKVLVVDEPTLGLAPVIAAEMLETIRGLADDGVAVLVIEENPATVLELADQVVVVALGRTVWEGPRIDLDDRLLENVYLGHSPESADAPQMPRK